MIFMCKPFFYLPTRLILCSFKRGLLDCNDSVVHWIVYLANWFSSLLIYLYMLQHHHHYHIVQATNIPRNTGLCVCSLQCLKTCNVVNSKHNNRKRKYVKLFDLINSLKSPVLLFIF